MLQLIILPARYIYEQYMRERYEGARKPQRLSSRTWSDYDLVRGDTYNY